MSTDLKWHKTGDNWQAGPYFVERCWAPGGKTSWYLTGPDWDGGSFDKLNGMAGAKWAATRHNNRRLDGAP
jgi:hypothetical protein